jgi:hypothetical protein
MKYSIYLGSTVIVDNPSNLHILLFKTLNKLIPAIKFSVSTSIEIFNFTNITINSSTYTRVIVGTGKYITLFKNIL